MVPKDLIDYFTASSAVAGTLIGLLFVSISLRYDAVFGGNAQYKAIAGAAFTALGNALSVSLWALVPNSNLGYPSAIVAMVSMSNTIRVHVGRDGRRDTSTTLFVMTVAVYLYEFVNGIVLIARPHNSSAVFGAAYIVFAAFATALSRSWELLQPEKPGPLGSPSPSAVEPARGPDR